VDPQVTWKAVDFGAELEEPLPAVAWRGLRGLPGSRFLPNSYQVRIERVLGSVETGNRLTLSTSLLFVNL
jgi:hypothetical protein